MFKLRDDVITKFTSLSYHDMALEMMGITFLSKYAPKPTETLEETCRISWQLAGPSYERRGVRPRRLTMRKTCASTTNTRRRRWRVQQCTQTSFPSLPMEQKRLFLGRLFHDDEDGEKCFSSFRSFFVPSVASAGCSRPTLAQLFPHSSFFYSRKF
jgi:hypothetical protein